MKKINKALIIIVLFITGCGFNVVKDTGIIGFDIKTIQSKGDKRINYKIRNKLNFYAEPGGKELVEIGLDTNKKKEVKEKNIKNEITKYQVTVDIVVSYVKIGQVNKNEFTVSRTGDYSVSSQRSQTLNNEKKLIDILVEDLADQILDELKTKINEL